MILKRWLIPLFALACLALPGTVLAQARPDLIVTSITGVPTSATPGMSFSVKVTIKNQGTALARAPFNLDLRISKNTTYTSSDLFVASKNVLANLAVGASAILAIKGKFPATVVTNRSSNFGPGDNYFFAWVDGPRSRVGESNEKNNFKAVKFTVPPHKLADLIVSKVTGLPATAAIGSSVSVSICVKNTGKADVAKANVGLYISDNSIISTGNNRIRSAAVAYVNAGGAEVCATVKGTVTGSKVGVGDRYWGAIVDYDKKVTESSDSNNNDFKAVKFKVTPSATKVDLEVVSINAPKTSSPGATISSIVCIRNNGPDKVTGTFKVGLYYSFSSTQTTFPSSRNLIAEISVAGLAKTTSCKSVSGKIPTGASLGSRYFGVFVDSGKAIAETNEKNNTKTAPVSLEGSDLIISTIKGFPSSLPKAGDTLTLEICVKNIGKVDAGAFKTGVYYSTNNFISTGDTRLATFNVTSLKAGTEFCQKNVAAKLPTSTKPTGFVGALVDYDRKVSESNESNNFVALPITAAPDLIVEAVKGVPKTAKSGDSVNVEICIKNTGNKDAGAFKTGIYHTTTTFFSATAATIGVLSWTGLKAGVSGCKKMTVKLPAGLKVGNNYVAAYVDKDLAVKESNEGNNRGTAKFSIPGPDLIIESITGVPKTATTNTPFSIVVKVKNRGNTPAKAPFRVEIRISKNTFFSSSDLLVTGKDITSDLAGGASTSVTLTGKFPAKFGSGSFSNFSIGANNLFAWVDRPTSKVAELDENNNDKGVAFTVVASDLVVSKVTGFPTKAKAGDTITASVCVKNNSSLDVGGAFKVAIYLSADKKITTADQKIAESSISSLAKGKEICVSVSGKLPANAVPGAGYFGAYADSTLAIGESNETNNGSTGVAVTIQRSGTVDLMVDSVTGVPAAATATESLNLRVCIKNKGTGASGAFKVGVFYSQDASISVVLDKKLKEAGIANILAGKTECTNITATLPATINGPKGADNWIGIIADFELKVGEATATFKDNIKAIKFVNSGGFPDLVVDSIKGVPATAKPGAAFTVDVCVKNTGNGDANPPIGLQLLIGGSSRASTFDIKIAKYTFTKAIGAGKTECAKIAAKFPTTVSSSSFGDFRIGDNYVHAWVDFDGKIKELSDSNNTKSQKFTLPGPDLTIDSYSWTPASFKPGDTLKVTVCIKNTGTGDAPKFKVGFYYSSNAFISTFSDTLLADIPFPKGVAKGKVVCVKDTPIVFKACLASGAKGYLAPYANYDRAFGEKSTSNNYPSSSAVKSFTTATYKPANLTIKELTGVPAVATKIKIGSELTLKVCVENKGTGDAAAFKVGIWYSSNSSLSRFSDTLMGTINFPNGAKAGKTVCVTQKVKVTSAVKPGSAFIGAWVNQPVVVCESSTSDNTKVVAANFDKFDQPDLFNSKVTLTNSYLGAGDSFTASFCVENKGKGDVFGSFKLSVRVSTNDFISTSDSEVGTFVMKDIKAGKTVCKSFTGKIPSSFTNGGWIGLVVDADSQINESDENNNSGPASSGIISARFNPPGPDLFLQEFTLSPNSGGPGTITQAKVCVQNVGTTDVKKAFKMVLYYSADSSFSATSDTKLKEIEYKVADLVKFKKGAPTYCRTISLTIPNASSVTPGTRYIIGFVDPDNATADANGTNDGRLAPFFVRSTTKPNLVVVSLKPATKTVAPGGKIEMETCIANYGVAIPATTSFKIALYFDTFTAAGKFFEYKEIKGFKANTKLCYKEIVTISAKAKLGKRQMAAWVDFENKVTNEVSDNDNQSFAVSLTIVGDADKDGVPSSLDCNDNDKNVFPAYNGKPAAKEVCDGQDNDCDKKVDEGFADLGKECKAGVGACEEKGKQACKADGSGVECSAKGLKAGTETCNGKDDDCNGKVDDGTKLCKLGEACTAGKCEVQKCANHGDCPTGSICKAGACTAPATCTKDEDCNKAAGETCDSGSCKAKACTKHEDCPKDNLCLGSVCVVACSTDKDCGTGFTCKNGRCWKGCTKDDECFGSQKCVEGSCQEGACSPACAKGQRCMASKCVEDNCYGYVCPNTQICQADKCVANPCEGKKCATGEFCRAGNCIKSCDGVSCKSGEYCIDGKCEANSCSGVKCDSGKICLNGSCVKDDCAGVTCKTKRYCNPAGQCVDDPCANVTCPTDLLCKVRKNQAQCDPKNAPPKEVAPEATAEVTPEATAEVAPEATAEATPEATTDASSSEPAVEAAPDASTKDDSVKEGSSTKEATGDIIAPKGGCDCSAAEAPFSGMMLLLLVGFLGLAIRRRRVNQNAA